MGDDSSKSQWAAPPPDAELRRLEPLVGTWQTDSHTHESILGPGVPVTSRETYAWLDGGYFLVNTYETGFGDDPIQKGIMYWGYDSESRAYRNIFFSNNGPYSEDGNRYEGHVQDDKLTYTGPARFQYDLDDAGRIKANADGSITVTWWLRNETGDWQIWMSLPFHRVG